MEDLKIIISYKNKFSLLKNDILTPIQTGRAIADEVFEEMYIQTQKSFLLWGTS